MIRRNSPIYGNHELNEEGRQLVTAIATAFAEHLGTETMDDKVLYAVTSWLRNGVESPEYWSVPAASKVLQDQIIITSNELLAAEPGARLLVLPSEIRLFEGCGWSVGEIETMFTVMGWHDTTNAASDAQIENAEP